MYTICADMSHVEKRCSVDIPQNVRFLLHRESDPVNEATIKNEQVLDIRKAILQIRFQGPIGREWLWPLTLKPNLALSGVRNAEASCKMVGGHLPAAMKE